MIANPAFHCDSNGANFLLVDPNPGFPWHALAVEVIVLQNLNDYFFKVSQERVEITTARLQIDDRINDLLTGSVKGDITSSLNLVLPYPTGGEGFLGSNDVVRGPAAADSNCRRMSQKEECIVSLSRDTFIDKLELDLMRALVVNFTEIEDARLWSCDA